MSLSEGKKVHELINKSGLQYDVFLGNLLVQMYANCQAMNEAQAVFSNMPKHNTFSWGILIGALVRVGKGKEAIQSFKQMLLECMVPDKVVLLSALSACTIQLALVEGKQIHVFVIGTLTESELTVRNALVNMYGKCGCLKEALETFHRMSERDVISWTSIIAVCTQHHQALQLFRRMQLEGMAPNRATFVSVLDACCSQDLLSEGKQVHIWILSGGCVLDVVVGTAIVNMYAKCGNLECAHKVFDELLEKNAVSWTAIITAYAQHGEGKEALQLYQQMQLEGATPDKVTYISVLCACASQALLSEGMQVHATIAESRFESDVAVGTSLVHMYSQCGKLEDARVMFDRMPERHVVSWNAMIAAYAQHGQGKEALHIFHKLQLQGALPDMVTFFIVLSACSHSGLTKEGCTCFISMIEDYGITPLVEHYNCMVDLLGRAGRLDGGENLIKSMPIDPKAITWMTMLGACKTHSDLERARLAAENVFVMDGKDATPYVLLANIYAASGRPDEALKLEAKATTAVHEP